MISQLQVSVHLRFFRGDTYEIAAVSYSVAFSREFDGGSFILTRLDNFNKTDVAVQEHFLPEEELFRNPSFIWSDTPMPRKSRRVEFLYERHTLQELQELGKRSREYYTDHKVRLEGCVLLRPGSCIGGAVGNTDGVEVCNQSDCHSVEDII